MIEFTETESTVLVTRGCGEEGMGSYCFVGTEFLSGMMKKIWKWIVVMVAKH